jgi:hypothetical protein
MGKALNWKPSVVTQKEAQMAFGGNEYRHPLHADIERAATDRMETDEAFTYVVDITPALAERMRAERPLNQRRMHKDTAKQYAKSIESGSWRSDMMDPIRFDARMSLVDGQHRIEAVILASKPLRGAFVVILKSEASTLALPIDSGRKRSRGNYERAQGLVIPRAVSSGLLRDAINFDIASNKNVSIVDQAMVVAQHPMLEIILSIPKIGQTYAGVVAGIARVLRHARDRGEAAEFFAHVLANDHNFRGRHSETIRYLSTWISSLRGKRAGDAMFLECASRTQLAWNSHRAGTQPKQMPRLYGDVKPQDIKVTP